MNFSQYVSNLISSLSLSNEERESTERNNLQKPINESREVIEVNDKKTDDESAAPSRRYLGQVLDVSEEESDEDLDDISQNIDRLDIKAREHECVRMIHTSRTQDANVVDANSVVASLIEIRHSDPVGTDRPRRNTNIRSYSDVEVIDDSDDEDWLPPEPQYRKERIPAALRKCIKVHYTRISPFGTLICYCCSAGVDDSFHCGHVLAEKNGGKATFDNLRPVCVTCNSSMRTTHMFEFMERYGLITRYPL